MSRFRLGTREKSDIDLEKKIQPAQDPQTGICRKNVTWLAFFPGSASLFLVMTPAVMLAVTTVNTMLGPKRDAKNSSEDQNHCFPSQGWHQTMIKNIT